MRWILEVLPWPTDSFWLMISATGRASKTPRAHSPYQNRSEITRIF